VPRPIVALVGRQNVGKSTLLNRIAGQPVSIVENLPGTTRDRIAAEAEWNGVEFSLIDTGGLEFVKDTALAKGVRQQVEIAMREADVIVFLTDGREGLLPDDFTVAEMLRKVGKPVVLAVNKVDNLKGEAEAAEFYRLGLGEPVAISAYHGRMVAELLDKLVALLPEGQATLEEEEALKVAIVGRPHVGKSLLLNSLLGQERAIVGESPGTTRDATDTPFEFEGKNILLIDTAGIRRKGKVEEGIEWYSVLRAMRAIERADIALVVLDATETLTAQDAHIAGYVEKAGKGIVVLVNKWDLATEKNKSVYDEYIRDRLKFASWAPILYISAKTRAGVNKVMPLVLQIQQERMMQIPDSEVDGLIKQAVSTHNLPRKGHKIFKLYSASQSGVKPPVFRFLVNDSRLIHFSYERFLENKIRDVYTFKGTPIRLVFKSRG
jgi:GTP-binding protein